VGRTCDDAVGEAFDKVARIMGLPYPGGPEISKLAEIARAKGPNENQFNLPKPMMHSKNLDFSFSGLKTAVLYLVQKLPSPIPEDTKIALAREFEDTVTEVIIKKVKKAIDLYGTKTLILGGGVVANKNIRKSIEELSKTENIALYLPEISHSTDNALMISIAGYFNRSKAVKKNSGLLEIRADGNLSFPR
jgi:N6-L-threonylcarbamoyladenine synthase